MGIECQLLGCNVVMLEKRTSFTRNNVLHIWPFVIEDLKSLGVKVFYPKFCTGSMMPHSSAPIWQIGGIIIKSSMSARRSSSRIPGTVNLEGEPRTDVLIQTLRLSFAFEATSWMPARRKVSYSRIFHARPRWALSDRDWAMSDRPSPQTPHFY